MEQSVAQWWSMTSAYLAAPASLLSGDFQLYLLLPVVGLVCLVAGTVLAVRAREKQAIWTLLPAIAAALAPIALEFAFGMLGWVGLGFALLVGLFGIGLWIHVLASDATKRLPVWLVGIFLLSFVAFCDFLAVVAVWGM
ncbi:MAG TPA: hypothetical protein VIN06_14980 [Devosia sp.]